MKLKKLTYTAAKKTNPFFKNMHLTKSDIIFSKQDLYAILRLKRSKINSNHTGVFIILAVTKNLTYPVTSLRFLFTHHLQLFYALLLIFTIMYILNNTLFIAYELGYFCKKLTHKTTSTTSYTIYPSVAL